MSAFIYPPIDYTNRDYASLRQSMLDAIPSRLPEWTSRSPQDFGVVLIELFATMGDILSYYADRVANEAFLPTATQRSSVLKLADLLNYRPQGTTAATVDLTFSVDPTLVVTIPAGTLVRSATADGALPVLFETDATIMTDVGGPTTAEVSATQGQTITDEQIGVSAGTFDQAFVLLQVPVVESSVSVRVQESLTSAAFTWSFVTNLLEAGPFDNAYTTSLDANGMLTVTFGDAVNGRIPPLSSVITATYRVGGGLVGNVNANTVTEIASPITGVSAVVNTGAAVGGNDVESTDSIRVNAPQSLVALNRAVTLADFTALALRVPLVAKANAESTVYSNVQVYVAPFGGQQPTHRLLNDVVAFFDDKKLAGVDVVAGSPIYVPIDITATVTVMATFNAGQVHAAVSTALADFLGFDAVSFGQLVSVSDIYAVTTVVPGVAYINLQLMNRQGFNGVRDVGLAANEIPVPGTVAISVLGGLVAGDLSGLGTVGVTTTMPDASSTPVILLARCDPLTSSTHLTVTWTPGANTTSWLVEVRYLDQFGVVLSRSQFGPTADPASFDLDVPTNTGAASIGVLTQAYNIDVGPAPSPVASIANPCAS